MDLPPLSELHEPLEPRAPAALASPYPITYFLCDKLVDAKVLKAALELERLPKLRKARIIGYQRAPCENESTVQWDGTDFGECSGEEIVKGVVFEALSEYEERKLAEHVGNNCGIKEVEMEVQCTSILGKVGKMKTVQGRIFVLEGEGDTLVGSARGSMSEPTVQGNPDFWDLVVPSGGPPRAPTQAEDDEEDVSEGSSTVAEGHPTPRLSPAISTLAESEIPHEPLEPLPASTIEAEPKTKDDGVEAESMNSTEAFLYLEAVRDRMEMFGEVIVEKPKDKKDMTVEAQKEELRKPSRSSYHAAVRDINDKQSSAPEAQPLTPIAAVRETKQEDQQTSVPEAQSSSPTPTLDEIKPDQTKSPAPETQPWSPTVPWKKENAVAPVRSSMHSESSYKENGSIRSRKTSESIQSLVDKFESLSPQKTPSSTPKKKT